MEAVMKTQILKALYLTTLAALAVAVLSLTACGGPDVGLPGAPPPVTVAFQSDLGGATLLVTVDLSNQSTWTEHAEVRIEAPGYAAAEAATGIVIEPGAVNRVFMGPVLDRDAIVAAAPGTEVQVYVTVTFDGVVIEQTFVLPVK